MIISDSAKLLCDFNNEFACQWGAEAGRWAIIEKGAIPSLEESVVDQVLLPSYPAALVLQGSAMLTSDPIRCQTGPGKLMFRYWSNGDIILQTCLIGYGSDKDLIGCIDQSTNTGKESRLAVFDLIKSIKEPFTLNLIPQWTRGVKNRFLVIDEIAYIGECSNIDLNHNSPVLPELQSTTIRAVNMATSDQSNTLIMKQVPTTEEKINSGRNLNELQDRLADPKAYHSAIVSYSECVY